jgi:hypothetical protein
VLFEKLIVIQYARNFLPLWNPVVHYHIQKGPILYYVSENNKMMNDNILVLIIFEHYKWPEYFSHKLYFTHLCSKHGSRVSSGSIVSDYGLDDRAIGVRSPAGAKDFSSNL